jgi:hypothetical protein
MLQYKLECPPLEVETGFPVLLSAFLSRVRTKGPGQTGGSGMLLRIFLPRISQLLHLHSTAGGHLVTLVYSSFRIYRGHECIEISYVGAEGEAWGVFLYRPRGLQRDVVYLVWPIASSYMSPNAGGGGSCGVSASEYS